MTDLTAISAPTPAEGTLHAKARPMAIGRGWQAAQLAALVGAYALFLTQPLMTVSSSARHLLETIHGMSPGLTVGRDDFIAGIERMTSWLQFDINAEQAVSYTVFSSLEALLREGSWLAAALIFLFALLLPMVKLVVRAAVLIAEDRPGFGAAHRFLLASNRFQMVDVLVIALIVVAFGSIGVSVTPDVGFYALAGYVALSAADTIRGGGDTR